MMADPAFFHKLVLEAGFAGASSVWYDLHMRGRSFRKDFDKVLISAAGNMTATTLAFY